MNYHSEGLSYTPTAAVEGVFNGVNSHNAAYWPGSEKFAQRPVILQVHAPVPIPGCASILRNDSCYSEETPAPDSASTHCYITTQYPTEFQPGRPQIQRHGYDSISSSTPCVTARSQVHSTFPTPSELLVELTSGANQYRHTPVSTRTQGLGRVTSTKHQRSNLSSRPIVEAKAITDSLLLASSLNDSSSETITSHEKKRHYLECLEHYVAFLHEHFRRNGLEPAALERISNYRCLNSRSIRVSILGGALDRSLLIQKAYQSLLIHMEKTTGQMQERIVREEQKVRHPTNLNCQTCLTITLVSTTPRGTTAKRECARDGSGLRANALIVHSNPFCDLPG
jgi:hypothetical protein